MDFLRRQGEPLQIQLEERASSSDSFVQNHEKEEHSRPEDNSKMMLSDLNVAMESSTKEVIKTEI